jgi:hypothetical protein
MRVLVSGASGLIGGALAAELERAGHGVVRLSRRPARGPNDASWDPERGTIDRDALRGIGAAVHLAGESVGAGRWSPQRKDRVLGSRAAGTRLLAATLATLEPRPEVMVSASAVGLYGDRGDERLADDAAPGRGFLADVARAWEEGTSAAEGSGMRVVRLRIALVLAPRGGALARLLLPFRLGLGGPLGGGRQWWSWIQLDDLVGAIRHAIARPDLRGAVNAAAPGAVTNAEFSRTLGKVLGRPALLPAPAWALRAVLGAEFADQMLLASQRVEPARLLASGFAFRFAGLEDALRHTLGQSVAR